MLQIENLSKFYRLKDRQIPALKSISFSVGSGEIVGVVGMSGGGKSTLLKILRGMEDFDHGRIIIDDITITPDSPPEMKRAQMATTAIHMQRDFALWTETALKNVLRRVHSRLTGFEVLPIPENPITKNVRGGYELPAPGWPRKKKRIIWPQFSAAGKSKG